MTQYDAIVIGSGISGGWAAKEFCDHGLTTLMLERGRPVQHLKDYPTATSNPWDFPHRGQVPRNVLDENPIVGRCYAYGESTKHFFVPDKAHPYIQEKPFDWIRGYQVGGKSLLWARQTQRWSPYEFDGPARDDFAVPWPISYTDLAPWYSHVERFAGISGNKDGLPQLPDGEFLPPWELNCVEQHIRDKIRERYKNRPVIIGRCAHLTKPQPVHLEQGRGQCQARDLCERGCPFGGYFSSNSATIPWAQRTGKLTLQPFSVVQSIIYDEKKGKATGVRVVDAQSKAVSEYYARIIFVNAACLNTNLILLNSKSTRFPQGFGNDHGLLGHYVAFQNYRGSINATFEGFSDKYYYGRRPTEVFIPAFRNVFHHEGLGFRRGYMGYFSASRSGWERGATTSTTAAPAASGATAPSIGAEFKNSITEPGPWRISMGMQGETLPKFENHVRLSPDLKDEWGIPQLITSVGYDDNDDRMTADFLSQGAEMLETGGCKDISGIDNHQSPGLDIHEMGGVRMGRDPKTSLLNEWNQFHACANVFVTDGACMTSTGNQNPSLTFMALTARAASHAIEEMKKQNL
jgi:choline dehydrogenase-like flavoprotein